MSSNIDIDATITFDSIKYYRELMKNNSPTSIPEAVSKGHVRTSGLGTAIENFQRKVSHYQSNLSQTSQADPSSTPSSLSVTKFYRMNYNGDLIQPLKHGWLYKKRDIFTGWRPRYIVVYNGRVEYYVNEHDRYPRDVVSILGAEVSLPKKCAVNGEPDHYYIIVEPRGLGGNKPLKLASQHVGVNAHAEASTWLRVFQIASKGSEYSSSHYLQNGGRTSSSANNTNGMSGLRPLDTSDPVPRHSSISSLPNPIASARNLFLRRSFAQESSDARESSVDVDEYDIWLIVKTVVAVGLTIMATAWYFYGIYGVVFSFGFVGILSMLITVYLFQQIQTTEAKVSPIRNNTRVQPVSTDVKVEHTQTSPTNAKATVTTNIATATVVPLPPISTQTERRSSPVDKQPSPTAISQGSTILVMTSRSSLTASGNPSRTSSNNITASSSADNGQSDFNGVFKDDSGDQLVPAIINQHNTAEQGAPLDTKRSPSFNVFQRKFFTASKDKDKDRQGESMAATPPTGNAMTTIPSMRPTSPERRKATSPTTISSLMKETAVEFQSNREEL